MKALFINARDITFDSRSKRNCELLANIYDIKAHHIGTNFNINNNLISIGSKNKATFCLNILKASLKKDISFIYTIGLPSLILALPAKIISGKKLIYDSRELYILDAEGESTYTWKHRLLERISITFVHAIIAANELRMNVMKNKYFSVKYFSYLLNIPYQITVKKKEKLNIKKNTLVYQGHIGAKRGLDKLIKSCNIISEKVKIIFIVPKDNREELKELMRYHGSDLEYDIFEFMPQEEMLSFISQFDIGFLSYELVGLNNIYCEPNKLYEYALAHLKILSSPQEKFVKSFKEFNIGHALTKEAWDSNDYKKMSTQIELLINKDCPKSEFEKFNSFHSNEKELWRLKKFTQSIFQ
ncbi:hypothetical protein [Halobacteriovorax sp. ZH5_bin.2]|uniref:hypothetical protein n=1 Tax=Halobacteriovorax sp. ZH5_bin.2 TaxID=3157727 RepID=UPI003716D679